ncbi:MAG: hypothetical protein ACFB15_04015 [Cyclobacteriaceae bacterium]
MKSLATLIIFLLSAVNVFGQQKAITDTGVEVILFDDNTWQYQNEEEDKPTEIPTNDKEFTKDEKATFLLKSSKLNVGFWIDPKEWSFTKAKDNPDAEYELSRKNEDLLAMILTEKIEIPLKTLKTIAVDNAKAFAPDATIIKEEYRTVNGLKVLMLQINGSMQGIKFSYYGYYFTSSNGTVQFITYTAQNLLDEYVEDCEKLLNGLVEIQ